LSGGDNWEALVVILVIGAVIILAAGLGLWIHNRWKKSKEASVHAFKEGAKEARPVGGSPPPSYQTAMEQSA